MYLIRLCLIIPLVCIFSACSDYSPYQDCKLPNDTLDQLATIEPNKSIRGIWELNSTLPLCNAEETQYFEFFSSRPLPLEARDTQLHIADQSNREPIGEFIENDPLIIFIDDYEFYATEITYEGDTINLISGTYITTTPPNDTSLMSGGSFVMTRIDELEAQFEAELLGVQ